ncbi:ferrochelatase [Draconibacterium sp. IB214405]|uniref:ferrochelatase n=1 Tax=Draconibacterium sp. IB214405 TaxID=3097352 RepID=UPI002A17F939|nr:ferrochelatase [Draconibacterium sp. IB214405]MDX8337832.1 ferrochelatase [Draconibacterium sp. IB214405]
MSAKTAVLLMNVGSPDKPTVPAVRKYLTEFLNDERVIDLPYLLRKFLVNVIIIPARAKNSTKLYRQLWTKKGSPLIYISDELKHKLQDEMGDDYEVFMGMRYGNPGYKAALADIKKKGFDKIILLPLFPHHAMSTTETSLVAAQKEIKKLGIKSEVFEVGQFYHDPKFIDAFAERIQQYKLQDFDHIIFSYHGLPNRHLEKCHPGIKVENCSCHKTMPEHGNLCYRATVYETSRLLAAQLNLQPEQYSVGFQSRLSKNWLTPFTDELLGELLEKGKKKILIAAPSFVTDCLETTLELGVEYGEEFLEKGGEKLQLVDSLNTEKSWVETLACLVRKSIS